MCYFVIVGVPAQHAGRMPEAFAPALRTAPTSNPNVRAALPAGFVAHLVTNGHCSCDLYGKPHSADDMEAARQHLRQKYAKKGWGEAKIARAVAQVKRNHLSGLSADLVPGLQALCAAAGSLAVMVHLCTGGTEDEPMALRRGEPCVPADLPERAATLVEDEVLFVRAEPSR